MRNRFCTITLTIVCFLFVPLIAGAQGGSPAAVLPEAHYRFSTAIEGQIVRHDFILYNKGSADLTIEKIKTG
ncbi:MAG TPA: hypothetical protein VLR50_17310 [Desulfobacterales bacterium]|nr:hypothetical protein [Desulfobacterales bacterium]